MNMNIPSPTTSIEKSILIRAPRGRVFRALTDHREFGAWFGANLESPFTPGGITEGQMTIPGFEYVRFHAVVVDITPERYFSYRWHPCALDAAYDYSKEEPTLVEFMLETVPDGTLLRVVESGFDGVPAFRREEAFVRNTNGWQFQLENIAQYAHAHP